MGFNAHLIKKIQALVEIHYQLYSNNTDYLKTFWTSLIFLNLNYNEIYDKTISILQLILLILFSRKSANLLYL